MCTSSDIGLVNPFKDRSSAIAKQPVAVVRELPLPRETNNKCFETGRTCDREMAAEIEIRRHVVRGVLEVLECRKVCAR
jgi:hypothetical protein